MDPGLSVTVPFDHYKKVRTKKQEETVMNMLSRKQWIDSQRPFEEVSIRVFDFLSLHALKSRNFRVR